MSGVGLWQAKDGGTMQKAGKLDGPLWPFILGILIGTAGIICGLSVPVGAYCDSAFSPAQDSAVKEDLRQAYSNFRETDYESVCNASAAQWSVLWWAVIALGLVVFCFGFVLMKRVRQTTAVTAAKQGVPAGRGKGVAAELAHLAQLRDQGIVTQSQFEQLKAKLIDG